MPILGKDSGAGGGGDVSVSGTPVSGQMTSWTAADTIQGLSDIVYDSGVLVAGHTESVSATTGNTLETNASNTTSGLTCTTWSDTASTSSRLSFKRSKSNTIGTQTTVADDDHLGFVFFSGSDGTGFKPSAYIASYVDGTPSSNNVPGRLALATYNGGSGTIQQIITSDGSIYFYNLSTISGQADVQYNTSTKELGYVTSSEQFKTNIRDEVDTSFVYNTPIKIYDRLDGSNNNEVSPLAEDVELTKPELCFYDENDNLLGYSNLATVPYLWKALQEQKAEIDTLKDQIATLQTEVAALQAK